MSDLIEYIDWSSVECLNAQPNKGCDRILKQVTDGRRFQQSLRFLLP